MHRWKAASIVASICTASWSAARAQDFGPRVLSTLVSPAQIAVGDLTGDGRDDIVCTDGAGFGVSIFPSQGRGHFGARISVPLPSSSNGALAKIALGDFDGDGDLDVLGITEGPGGCPLYAFVNDATQTYAAVALLTVGTAGRALDVGDMNGDGRLDVVVACDSAPQQIKVFLGLGGGTFAAPTTTAMIGSTFAYDLVVAPFDGDAYLDVATANGSSPATLTTLFGNGAGGLSAPTNIAAAAASQEIVAGRWNAGATLDLALATFSNSVLLYDNPGNGAFTASGTLAAAASGVTGLASGDVDADGMVDLVAVAGGRIVVWRGLGGGSFAPAFAIDDQAHDTIAVGDLDGDGIDDLAVPRDTYRQIQILTGAPSGLFGNAQRIVQPSGSNDIAAGDLNGDGRIDIVSGSSSAPAVDVRLGQAGGGFQPATTIATGTTTSVVRLGKINGDASLDLLAFSSSGAAQTLMGNGAGGFGPPIAGGSWQGVTPSELLDLTGDGFADFAYRYLNLIGTTIVEGHGVVQGNGAGGFAFVYGSSAPAYAAVVGDWNEDGLGDVAFLESSGLDFVMSNGGGSFSPGVSVAVTASQTPPQVIDLDGDTHLDVLCAVANGFVVARGDGAGNFTLLGPFGSGASTGVTAIDVDLVALRSNSGIEIYRGSIGTGFTSITKIATFGSLVNHVLAIEATGDTLPDLVTNAINSGAFTLHPNLGAVAGPVAYCTAKLTSNGCVPSIASSGTPSASATSGFSITCSNVINQKNGLLFYSLTGRRAVPFQGGTMCVLTPIARTPLQNSAGNPPPDDCSGTFAIDMNAFAHGLAGGSPQPALLVQGTAVTAQGWGRDPGSPSPTMLSNAIEYLVGP